MQHVSAYGYPTPPASPAFDQKRTIQQHNAPGHQARLVPVAPEDRLGTVLAGSLQLTGILGTGAYGVVYQAVDRQTNQQYAVKCLSKFNPDGSPLDRRQVIFQAREIRLHYLASAHPNVVSMHKIIDHPDCIYVLLEYCPEGDLFFNITERNQYVGKDQLAKQVFLQILDAVEHCHSLGIYHRDLKPENILVTDNGETVKLADFGLATSSERSEDYGCGSTFYMSPECLDHSSRRPFYYCAPNDVWSLGVILVNLTCGRNPWKQASFEDSTYRAFTKSPGFLKTILPLSDELNDILGRIFTRNPEQRIALSELRARIVACSRFTEQQQPQLQPLPVVMPLHISPVSPVCTPAYEDYEESAVEDDYDYDAPLSPASCGSVSDDGSTCSSDDGSLTSSCSSLGELEDDDDDMIEEPPEVKTPPPLPEGPTFAPAPQEPSIVSNPPEFVHYPGSMPEALEQTQPPCALKSSFPFVWDVFKFVQPPVMHHPVPFHHQVPLFAPLQGCY